MRETSFIRQNRQKWQEFERFLRGDQQDAEKLSALFVQVTDDLSYSRTYYPNRMVRVYLNGLAQRAFSLIYRRHQGHQGRFRAFWLEELPRLMWESRRALMLSFLVFVLSMSVGALSTAMDIQFAELILGESYVAMTKANIAAGDPMAVYKQREQLGMSLGITINNLLVAFITFVTGVFFAMGTVIALIRNGIMVGAFQYFFVEQGLFWESFLTIWIHGTLEISAIILAGAAGLTMGEGLIFPGTYRRLQAFQRSARRGLKLMLGISPVFVLAGFIEGYFTRYTEMPDMLRILFIGSSLLFVLVYFVWFPWMKSRWGTEQPVAASPLAPEPELNLDLGLIRTNGEVLSVAYALARRYAGLMLGGSFMASVVYLVLVVLVVDKPLVRLLAFPEGMFSVLTAVAQFFFQADHPYTLPGVSWFYVVIIFLTAQLVMNKAIHQGRKLRWLDIVHILPYAAVMVVMLGHSTEPVMLVGVLVLPYLMLLWMINLGEGAPWFRAVYRLQQLAGAQLLRVMGLSVLMLLVSMLFYTIGDSAILKLQLELVSWLVNLSDEGMATFSVLLLSMVQLVLLGFFLMMYLMGLKLLYYTLLEIRDAPVLREKTASIGRIRTIRGLEKE